MCFNVRKHNMGHMRLAKIQISLRMHAFWIAKDATFFRVGNEASDQAARMHRLL